MGVRSNASLRVLLAVLLGAACTAVPPSPSSTTSATPTSTSTPQTSPTPGPPTLIPTPDTSPDSTPSTTPSTPSPGPSATPQSTPPASLRDGAYRLADVLPLLVVGPEDRSGYARSLFRLWIDADGDGCNTRKEVLLRDAVVTPSIGPRCVLYGGQWLSPYDQLSFTEASGLDIDHVVPLAEAWDSGASLWTAAERQAYANDLGVPFALLAVSAHSNRTKSDGDPADWLPRSGFVCQYLADWVGVKARWTLTIDPVERSAIASHSECDGAIVTVAIAPPA